ncbi:hypothetical protein VTK73DRAFT_7767 [Phialemonium thermophilum]|uniref:Uncharacterized protein n=1 Tax=Phialemonium thermophilum TaxID=223376 RepID=A0ABR3XRI6_9PEZI
MCAALCASGALLSRPRLSCAAWAQHSWVLQSCVPEHQSPVTTRGRLERQSTLRQTSNGTVIGGVSYGPGLTGNELQLLHEIAKQGPNRAPSNAPHGTEAWQFDRLEGAAYSAQEPSSDFRRTPTILHVFKDPRRAFRYLYPLTLGQARSEDATSDLRDKLDQIPGLVFGTSTPKDNRRDPAQVRDEIATLPQTTFSELLRSLDPLTIVSKEMDHLSPYYHGPGMVQLTQLKEAVDELGVRRVYARLLSVAMAASSVRQAAGLGLMRSDFEVLLRCAGAASNYAAARKIWFMMETAGQVGIRDRGLYTEFLRARFLTDPLYVQFDVGKIRTSPLSLEHMRLKHRDTAIRRVAAFRNQRAVRQRHRFGHSSSWAGREEPLMRTLRRRWPLLRVYFGSLRLGHGLDESFLCAAMVAMGRSGMIGLLEKKILRNVWGICVEHLPGGDIRVSGGTDAYGPGSLLRPTTRLLDAVVESFGSASQILTALELLRFISSRYDIPISDRTWFRLLEWAYSSGTRPNKTEWKMAGWKWPLVPSTAVQSIWNIMVSPPYNVQPGFRQHAIMTRSLIYRGRLKEAMQRLLDLRQAYETNLVELEEALYEQLAAARFGVDSSETMRRYQRARVRKQEMWHEIQYCCQQLFQRVRCGRIDDVLTVRLVPQFIAAFRRFLFEDVKYKIATGRVRIRGPNPASPIRMRRVRRLEQTPVYVCGLRGDYAIARRDRKILRNVLLPHHDGAKIYGGMLQDQLPSRRALELEFT